MIKFFYKKYKAFFVSEDKRTNNIVINTVISFGIKGGNILIGLLLVPLIIGYVDSTQYGIWLTISSIVSWMSFFDIGLGHGLRNHLAMCVANNKIQEARTYISTTYAVLIIISSILFAITQFINPLVDWRAFLNIPSSVILNIHFVMLVVFSSFCLQFVVQIINTILLALQESAISAFLNFLGQFFVLLAVFVVKNFAEGKLTVLVIILTGVPVIVLSVSSLIFFKTKLKRFAPTLKNTHPVLNISLA